MQRTGQLIFGYIVILVAPLFATAQSKVDFSAQIRQRYEIDKRSFRSDIGANSFNLLRSRAGVRLSTQNHVSIFIQLQDSRRFGEETNTLSDGSADNLDFHQAYFQVDSLFELPVLVKVGRMEVIYGGERLLGAVGWDNIGRSFDGAVARVKPKNFTVDVFALQEFEKSNPENEGDRSIYGFFGELQLSPVVSAQPFFIWQRQKPTEAFNQRTIGLNLAGKARGLTATAEFAYQWGTAAGKDVGAYFFALNADYAFRGRSKPRIGAGLDYLSGDSDPDDLEIGVFNTLYATNHKYYGFMDYFLNIPVHTRGLGLADWQLRSALSPANKLKTALAVHFFRSAQDFATDQGRTTRGFGTEFDLTANFQYNQNATLVMGLSLFSPGEIFKATRGGDATATWFYLMSIINL